MMKLDADFRTRTTMGMTYCNAFDCIYDDYRDVANVDFAISYVKKLFTKNHFDPCISFVKDTTLGRIYEDWKDNKKGYTLLLFMGAHDETKWVEKLTAKDIKAFYLRCADKAMENVAY